MLSKMKANTKICCEVSMRATRNWSNGVEVKKLGQLSATKKAQRSKRNQKEDICLNCKKEKCKGICKEFKK
jgi:hypothetical protein